MSPFGQSVLARSTCRFGLFSCAVIGFRIEGTVPLLKSVNDTASFAFGIRRDCPSRARKSMYLSAHCRFGLFALTPSESVQPPVARVCAAVSPLGIVKKPAWKFGLIDLMLFSTPAGATYHSA